MSRKQELDALRSKLAPPVTRFHLAEFDPSWEELDHKRAVMTDPQRILARVLKWIESERANGRSAGLVEGQQVNGSTLTLEAVHVT